MSGIKPKTWLLLQRTVRFGDTDAAGVMHFANLFRWSHEAWEESLYSFGLSAHEIFPGCSDKVGDPGVALPVLHAHADFWSPLKAGEVLFVELIPHRLDKDSFQVKSRFKRDQVEVAQSLIHHVSINAKTRQRCALPRCIDLWLEASSATINS